MKVFITFLLLVSFNSYSQTAEPKPGVETMIKKAKKERKKKIEMCHECGKPEENCDCKGEEHRKK